MDLKTIRLLHDYNRWVNERLLATVHQVPADRLTEKLGASFDSIHATLAHMLGAEVTWLSRWKGVSPPRLLNGDDFASLEEIETRWVQHRKEMDAFLVALTQEQLETSISYKSSAGSIYTLPLWQLLVHVVNHATHHRSELADMLTRTGHAPAPTDLLRYSLEKTGQA